MPVVFTAHGHPMNAIRDNAFTRFLGAWPSSLPAIRAILAVSAHWETEGLAATGSAAPRTIHDFDGFPDGLYAIRYAAPGAPALAARVVDLLTAAGFEASVDPARGLDHGAWAPLRRIVPDASIPVVQLSLDAGASMERHVEAGRALAPLRSEGVLVLGSGNVVHNLRTVDFEDEEAAVEPWARAFDAWVASRLEAWDLESLARFEEKAPDGRRAHPTTEHFEPLAVVAGAAGPRPLVSFPYVGFEHATIGMRCVQLG